MEQREVENWRKSTRSNGGGTACVEVGSAVGKILVRDTTDREAGSLVISAAAFEALTDEIKGSLGTVKNPGATAM
jgi:hypothetical protein